MLCVCYFVSKDVHVVLSQCTHVKPLINNGTDCQMFVKFGMNIIPLEIKQLDTQKVV